MSMDAILVKYDPSGNELWNRSWGAPTLYEAARSVAADSTGAYLTSLKFDFTSMTGNTSLLKFDNDGDALWNSTMTGVEMGGVMALAGQNIYVAGGAQGLNKEEPSCRHEMDLDVIFGIYDNAGAGKWTERWGTTDDDEIAAVAADSSGAYCAGATEAGYNTSSYDTLLIRLDADGRVAWQKKWGGNSSEEATAVALSGGDVFVAGRTESNETPSHLFLIRTDAGGAGWTGIVFPSAGIDYMPYMIIASVAVICAVCTVVVFYIGRKRGLIKE
jgi:hypothetical protein